MASTIAHPTASQVLSNVAQLHRVLEEAGLSTKARQRVIDDPTFRAKLVALWNHDLLPVGATTSIATAARIMGANFHGAESLRHLGVSIPNPLQIQLFRSVPFSSEVLKECKDTHVLVACAGLSLHEVRKSQPDLFEYKAEKWWNSQPYFRSFAKVGWYLIRKGPVPNSLNEAWNDQVKLLSDMETVPSASVLAQAVLIHYLDTGTRLFEDAIVRVSDLDSRGDQFVVGGFSRGFCVGDFWWNAVCNESLGIASARNPS